MTVADLIILNDSTLYDNVANEIEASEVNSLVAELINSSFIKDMDGNASILTNGSDVLFEGVGGTILSIIGGTKRIGINQPTSISSLLTLKATGVTGGTSSFSILENGEAYSLFKVLDNGYITSRAHTYKISAADGSGYFTEIGTTGGVPTLNLDGPSNSVTAEASAVSTKYLLGIAGKATFAIGKNALSAAKNAEANTNTLYFFKGTPPTVSETDGVSIYSDYRGGVAGNTSIFFRSEGGYITTLGKFSGFNVANPTANLEVLATASTSGHKILDLKGAGGATSFAVNGIGEIEVFRPLYTYSRRLVIGGANAETTSDAGSYENIVIAGYANVNSILGSVIVGSHNNNPVGHAANNWYGQSIYLGNGNKGGGLKFGLSNFGVGNAFGVLNEGNGSLAEKSFLYGHSNRLSDIGGYPNATGTHVYGNFVQIASNININSAIFWGMDNALSPPSMSLRNSTLSLNATVWGAGYDVNSAGAVIFGKSVAPVTLPDFSVASYGKLKPAGVGSGDYVFTIKNNSLNEIQLYRQDLGAAPTTKDIASFLQRLGLANLI